MPDSVSPNTVVATRSLLNLVQPPHLSTVTNVRVEKSNEFFLYAPGYLDPELYVTARVGSDGSLLVHFAENVFHSADYRVAALPA